MDTPTPALPAPPERPADEECCMRGCCPCVFDYYRTAMEKWRARVRELGGDPEAIETALDRG